MTWVYMIIVLVLYGLSHSLLIRWLREGGYYGEKQKVRRMEWRFDSFEVKAVTFTLAFAGMILTHYIAPSLSYFMAVLLVFTSLMNYREREEQEQG